MSSRAGARAPLEAHLPTGAERLLITLAVMSATLMQVLDTTIVNVALPHMAGELGATTDQISWVLTSYLVSSAIVMPLTGYFADTLGRKRFLLVAIGGFVASSALCGIAGNLFEIVFFRLLQGVFGAALVPLSQAIMGDAYPIEDRGISANGSLEYGRAVDCIAAKADEIGADLSVVGHRHRGRLERWWSESDEETLLERVACSFLVAAAME